MARKAIDNHMKVINRKVTQPLAQRSCKCQWVKCSNGRADIKRSVVKIVTFVQSTSLYSRTRTWTRKKQPNPVLGLVGWRRFLVIELALAVLSLWTRTMRKRLMNIYRSSVVIPNEYVKNSLGLPMQPKIVTPVQITNTTGGTELNTKRWSQCRYSIEPVQYVADGRVILWIRNQNVLKSMTAFWPRISMMLSWCSSKRRICCETALTTSSRLYKDKNGNLWQHYRRRTTTNQKQVYCKCRCTSAH